MHIKTLTIIPLFLFLTQTLTTPLIPRDASTVLTDLNTISTDLDSFMDALKVFDGGLLDALAIQTQEQALEDDIDKATRDTKNSEEFTTDESADVREALLGLEPDILDSIDLVVAKKSPINDAGVGSLVVSDLQNLESKTDALSEALQSKSTPSDAERIAAHTTTIDKAFESALAVFS